VTLTFKLDLERVKMNRRADNTHSGPIVLPGPLKCEVIINSSADILNLYIIFTRHFASSDAVYLVRGRKHSEERNVTVCRPSVCPFVCPVGMLTVTHQGTFRPAYISAKR